MEESEGCIGIARAEFFSALYSSIVILSALSSTADVGMNVVPQHITLQLIVFHCTIQTKLNVI